jgi:hypothetical protein
MIRAILWTLATREMADVNNTIANITVGVRFENITNQWGGYNATVNQSAPDWGRLLWELASIYPDFMGNIAWFLLFAIPFFMMWIAHADMVPAGLLGIFFALYAFMFIPDIWQMSSVFFIVLGATAVIMGIYLRRP